MSRFVVIHEDKGLAFGIDHVCGEFLQIWRRPKEQEERRQQDLYGPDPEEMLVDKDPRFDKDFTYETMVKLITEHGFKLEELEKVAVI